MDDDEDQDGREIWGCIAEALGITQDEVMSLIGAEQQLPVSRWPMIGEPSWA